MLEIKLFNRNHVRPSIAVLAALALFACDSTLKREASVQSEGTPMEQQASPSSDAAFSAAPSRRGTGGGGGGGIGGVGPGGGLERGSVRVGEPTRIAPANLPPPQPGVLPSQITDTPQQAMIIKNGDATIEVDSLEIALAAVAQLAQRLGGQVANSSIQTGKRDIRSASVTLRIPAAQFDVAMGGLKPLGKVEQQNVHSEDVTEQFVDMTARAKNAKRLEERLINLLATRTGKLEDVLAVERELARVREEIERYEGQLRYLRTRAAISTLTINLHEPFPIVKSPGGTNVLVHALRRAWRNFVGLVASAIASLGVLIPLAIFGFILLLILRRLGLLPRFRRPPPPPATPQS